MENNHIAPGNSLQLSQSKDTHTEPDFSINFDFDSLNQAVDSMAKDAGTVPVGGSLLLQSLLDAESKLKMAKATEIKKKRAILKQGETPIIFPNTINVIQGQAGSHKSRLVETICSAFLKKNGTAGELLGFSRVAVECEHLVVYVDTERNISEQFPLALQSIQEMAGYEKGANPFGFRYTSLIEIARQERFKALNEYLDHLRMEFPTRPMFIVLDVATDCISDFNKVDKSMELIDLMNVAVNKQDVCFLCLIHENPGSEKARGHFGTELMNKASMVMSVGFEKDANNNPTELIRIKFLKTRGTGKPAPIHVKYCETVRGLVLADSGDVASVMASRKKTAPVENVVEHLEMYFGDVDEIARIELLEKLQLDFDASQRTVEDRLIEIMEINLQITNRNGQPCQLDKNRQGQKIFYQLKPINPNPL